MTTTSSSLFPVILHHLRLCWNFLLSLFHIRPANRSGSSSAIISLTNLLSKSRPQLLTFDNGTQVSIGNQIAEGGFSYVFEAFPVSTSSSVSSSSDHTTKKYALKRINCSDQELLQSCRHEAGIHRSLPRHHPNLLELLGLKFEQENHNQSSSSLSGEYNVCYMLFPHVPNSLRGEITRRNILSNTATNTGNYSNHSHTASRRRPFTITEALHLFRGILDGLLTMHNTNLSHRDVKLENVLLSQSTYTDHHHTNSKSTVTPILMDYGSAGPLQSTPLTTRNAILQLIELAESHTTFSYRPPELSDVGNLRASSSCVVDYGRVDVWSLGCVLFGILHGVSPFEMDFVRRSGGSEMIGQQHQQQQYGMVRVVECTTLKILGEVPFPPWAGNGLGDDDPSVIGDGSDGRYPLSLYNFIRYMVQQDRMSRPTLYEVRERFGQLHYELLGEEWIPYSDSCGRGGSGSGDDRSSHVELDGGHDDFDSLIASRDFV